MAGAYEIVSDCFRVVIIEENNEEQGNSTPKVNEVEYSTVLSLTISNRTFFSNGSCLMPWKNMMGRLA